MNRTCSFCVSPATVRDLCDTHANLVQVAPPVAHVPMLFKGSDRGQIRDRQWLFKHGREILAGNNPQDMRQVAARMPHSQAGDRLRRMLIKRAQELE